MTRYIAVISGKGGVGKTTTTINLGVALKNFGKSSVIVDANTITPNIGLHLGIPPSPINFNSVLNGKAELGDVITTHESGIKIVPAALSVLESVNNFSVDFREALSPLDGKADFVLLDCGAGLWGQIAKATKASDEVLVITNPELPALVDALKSIKMAEKLGVSLRGIVLNKVGGNGYAVRDDTIKGILNGYKIISEVPYDKNVTRSVNLRKPLVSFKPYSPAARSFRKLAADLSGMQYKESFWEWIFGII